MDGHVRTGVQRRTLIGALVGAGLVGALTFGLASSGSDDGPGGQDISDVDETTTTVDDTSTSTSDPVTTTLEMATTAAPTTAPPATSAPRIEDQVADHEQRIDQLEATTTTTRPPTTTTTSTTPTTQVVDCYDDC